MAIDWKKVRTGAASFAKMIKYACRFSHNPHFRSAIGRYVGEDNVEPFYALWTPFCEFWEATLSADITPYQIGGVVSGPGDGGADGRPEG